ncbi:MAG: endonuclease/exonuclease/phosphatase family protein [Chitinophagaceae bacterium]|nr:endonuclease/exonuclease/phosphatase family protein [Chitinophagaceae bacterium]
MVAHDKPTFTFDIDLDKEIKALRTHKNKDDRKIPDKTDDKLLVATWNLTNFGLQKRTEEHIKLMAEVLSWFDLVAVQEVADDLTHFNKLLKFLGGSYKAFFSDIGGNAERLGFVYDSAKVNPVGMVAELVIKKKSGGTFTIEVGEESITVDFDDYNRNPYMATFDAGGFRFTVISVHAYYGDKKLRVAENKALSTWVKNRSQKPDINLPSKNIIMLGDFNLEAMKPTDPNFKVFKENGLYLPKHETAFIDGTNLAGDKHYDQLMFFPSQTLQAFNGKVGVYDFDNALFKKLWSSLGADNKKDFHIYTRYYIADHRPLWVQFKI